MTERSSRSVSTWNSSSTPAARGMGWRSVVVIAAPTRRLSGGSDDCRRELPSIAAEWRRSIWTAGVSIKPPISMLPSLN